MYEEIASFLLKQTSIKDLINLILEKRNNLAILIENNKFIKLYTHEYRQLLMNKVNDSLNKKYLNKTIVPIGLKKMYFYENKDDSNQKNIAQRLIHDKIDQIVYPSIYDYKTKNPAKNTTFALQYLNEYNNVEINSIIYDLEQEIKQYFWEKDKKYLNFNSKLNDQKKLLTPDEIKDLTKRIIFLVAGSKDNIEKFLVINKNQINLVVKNQNLINFQSYKFYSEEASKYLTQSENILKLISINNTTNTINIEFSEKNYEIVTEIEKEISEFKLSSKNLQELAITNIIDNLYLEVINEHEKIKNELQLVFDIFSEKEKLELKLFKEIKKELVLNNKLEKINSTNIRKENSEIRKIKTIIIKTVSEQNKSKKQELQDLSALRLEIAKKKFRKKVEKSEEY